MKITQEEYRRDPAKYVRLSKKEVVEIIGVNGQVRARLSHPPYKDDEEEKEMLYDLTPEGWEEAGVPTKTRVAAGVLPFVLGWGELRVRAKKLQLEVKDASFRPAVAAIHSRAEKLFQAEGTSEELKKQIAQLCCGDNSCLFWPRGLSKGPGTNGGCRCLEFVPSDVRRKLNSLFQLHRLLHDAEMLAKVMP